MNNLIGFLKWQWGKWELWQKMFVFSTTFIVLALISPRPYSQFLFTIPFLIVFGYTFKWFVLDNIIKSYQEYKKEKYGMFENIKNSENS